VAFDKQKTALVYFLSGNITLVVFLAWETYPTCGLVGFLAKKTTQKTHLCGVLIV
jgi:type III secretory pathway component EscT